MMYRVLVFSALGVLGACSNSNATPESTSAADKTAAKPTPAKAAAPAAAKAPAPAAVEIPADAVKVVVEANDMMQFNLKEIKVPAGSTVALTLKHVGKIAKAAMGHNLVILTAGADVNGFATAAMSAKDEDYLPKAQAASVLAATKLLGGGESDTIVFKAPAAGSYDFLCSFPGHYAIMKGKFIVE